MTSRRLRLTTAQLAVAILVATLALPSPALARSTDESTSSATSGVRASAPRHPGESQTVPAPGPDEVSLTGTLEFASGDDFVARVSTDFAWLETEEGSVPLALTGRGAERLAHTKVTIIGRRRPDGTLVAASNRVYARGSVPNAGSPAPGSDATPWDEAAPAVTSQSGQPAATAPETRRIAVIVARYSDVASYPVTLAQAQDTFINHATASVSKYWEATTRGRVTTTTSVYGLWPLGVTQCPGGSYSFQSTINAANSYALAHGVSLATFDHVIVWTRQPSCVTSAGVGQVPGKWIQMMFDWSFASDQPAFSAMVATHEMGHNLGLYHSNGLVCVDGSSNQLPLSGSCQSAEYWDEYTTLGMVGAPDHALLDADRLQSKGWLDSGEWQTPTAVGTYSLVPTYSGTPGVRLLRIPRPATVVVVPEGQTGSWTIEIRSTLTGTAWDQFVAVPGYPDLPEATTGVSIRYSEDQYRAQGFYGDSYLVDTSADGTGSSFDFFDAPLQAGGTFTDAAGGFTFFVASVSGSGATVTIGDTMAPTVPLSFEGVAVPAGGAQLSWQPAWDNLGLSGYLLYRNGVQVGSVGATTLTFTDPPAGIGGTVTYTVRAIDTAGNLGPAATADVTLSSPPAAPTGAVAAAGNAAAQVSWTAPAPNGSPPATSYTVTSLPGGMTCTVAVPTTSCVVTGLTNSTSYTFTVTATNSVGTGPASDPSNAVTPSALLPGRPTAVNGVPGNAVVTVSWAAPADQGGSTITGYTATAAPGGASCPWTSGPLTCTVGGLTNGVAYTFTVTATNSQGTSVPSEPSAPIAPVTRPDPPLNVVAMGLVASALVSWDAGANGGSAITAYDVVSSPGGGSCHTTGARSCTVAGLTNRTWYTFTVTATNLAGTSDPSAASPRAMPLSGATYVPVVPNRIADSRKPYGVSGKLRYKVPASFKVTDQSADPALNVPAGAIAVTGNLTVTNATVRGFFVLTPTRPDPLPNVSTLNFQNGVNQANGVTVPLGPGGTLWVTYVAASSAGATADVIFDVTGYYTADTSGATYVPVVPNRIADSRKPYGVSGKLRYKVPASFKVTDQSADPALNVPAGAIAVTGNLTVTNATVRGFFVLTPTRPDPLPNVSTLNFQNGVNQANGVTVPLGPGGTLWVTYVAASSAGATADVIFDVTGYYTADTSGATYVPVVPNRIADSRKPYGVSGKLRYKVPASFKVTDQSADPALNVPAGAIAVTGNLTVTNATVRGFFVLTPTRPDPLPNVSTLNFQNGVNQANGVTVPLGPGGTLWVTYVAASSAGATADVIFDVTGYYTTG